MSIFFQALMSVSLLLGFAMPNHAATSEKKVIEGEQLRTSYVWYDGKQQEHRVWVNPTLVAEINPTPAGDNALKSAFPDMRQVPSRYRGIRLWEFNPETQMDKIISRAQSSDSAGRYFQVMHDSPSGSAPIRLALGNIIVHFNPEWSESAVQQWAAARKLQILRKLESGPNNYLIQSGPGLDALNLANSLHQSSGVTAAFPDWLIPRGL